MDRYKYKYGYEYRYKYEYDNSKRVTERLVSRGGDLYRTYDVPPSGFHRGLEMKDVRGADARGVHLVQIWI